MFVASGSAVRMFGLKVIKRDQFGLFITTSVEKRNLCDRDGRTCVDPQMSDVEDYCFSKHYLSVKTFRVESGMTLSVPIRNLNYRSCDYIKIKNTMGARRG